MYGWAKVVFVIASNSQYAFFDDIHKRKNWKLIEFRKRIVQFSHFVFGIQIVRHNTAVQEAFDE